MTITRRPPAFGKDHLEGGRGALYCRVSKAKTTPRPGEIITDKSTEDQDRDGRQIFGRRGLIVADVYSDPDISASRFAIEKERPQFNRMLADVRAGKLDLIWFWELSRSQRRLGVFADLRDLCRDHGVLWMVGDTVYDTTRYEDMMLLGVLSIVAEGESEIKSKNVRRGVASNAAAGLPPGPLVYGYRRVYTPGPPGRRLADALDRQEPDQLDDDGEPVTGSPAWVVQETFARFSAGWGLARIAHDLNQRGIPVGRKPGQGNTSADPRWRDTRLKSMLKNPAYAGLRVHKGEIQEVTAVWPALVDLAMFWAVQAMFAEPDRKKHRIGVEPKHLLASVVRCGSCGRPMKWGCDPRGVGIYACKEMGCHAVGIKEEWLDEYVVDKIVLWGSDPAVYTALTKVENSDAGAAARADIDRLTTELEETRQLFDDGEMSPVMAARKEQKLLEQIRDAEQRSRDAVMPKVLADNIGPAFAHRWVNVLDIPVKRQILRHVADIRVMPAGKGNYHRMVAGRVIWRWLLGPVAEDAVTAGYVQPAERMAGRREKVTQLRAEGWTRQAIAAELGVSLSTVWKDEHDYRAVT